LLVRGVMRTVVLSATLAAVLTPAGAVAQSITLTEADALARLTSTSPRVRAIRAGIEVARADVLTAGRWPNPRITFDRESAAGIVAVGGEPVRAPLPDVDALVEHAESTRGELFALRKEIDAARFAGRAADRRRIPEPEVVAGTKSSTAGGGDLGSVVTVHASV